MKNLRMKLIGSVTSVILALTGSGCMEMAARGYGTDAETPEEVLGWAIVEDAAGKYEQQQRNLEIAREGKSENNIYIIQRADRKYITVMPQERSKPYTIRRKDGKYITILP